MEEQSCPTGVRLREKVNWQIGKCEEDVQSDTEKIAFTTCDFIVDQLTIRPAGLTQRAHRSHVCVSIDLSSSNITVNKICSRNSEINVRVFHSVEPYRDDLQVQKLECGSERMKRTGLLRQAATHVFKIIDKKDRITPLLFPRNRGIWGKSESYGFKSIEASWSYILEKSVKTSQKFLYSAQ